PAPFAAPFAAPAARGRRRLPRAGSFSVGVAEPGGASERTTRLLYRAIGIGGLFFAIMSVPPFLSQVHRPHINAAVAAWILVVGIPVVVAVLAQRAPLKLLRTLSIVEAVTYLFVLGFWMLVRAAPLGSSNDTPWILSLAGIAVVIVAIGSRSSVAWAYTITACVMSGIVRGFTTNEPRGVLVGVESGLYLLLLMSIFVGLTMATRRRAISIDLAAQAVRQVESARVAEIARKRERLTIDALVHDSVLSTLLIAGLGRAERAAISRQAQASLAELDALRHQSGPVTVSGAEFADRLVVLVTDLAPGATLRVALPDTMTLPTDAATALLGAVGEALRNSMASAGGPMRASVARRVELTALGGSGVGSVGSGGGVSGGGRLGSVGSGGGDSGSGDAGGLRLIVHDDGVGFNRQAVAAGRLGVAQSILGRMHALPGGHAAVRSRPGHGTTVTLAYEPKPAASVCPTEVAPESEPAAPACPAASIAESGPAAPACPADATPELEPEAANAPFRPAAPLTPPAAPPSRGLRALGAPGKARSPQLDPPASVAVPGNTLAPTLPFAGLLGLSPTMTRTMLVFFVLLHLLAAVSNAQSWRSLTLELITFLMVSFAAVWISRPARDPLPLVRTGLILAVCTVASTFVFLRAAPVTPVHTSAFWNLGAIIVILLVLVGRGRPVWAWTTYFALLTIAEIWAITGGLSPYAGLSLLIQHAGLLAAGSFFIFQLRRLAAALGGVTRDRLAFAAAEATLTAAVEEREAQFTRVNALARGVLERIAGSRPFSDVDRAEFLAVEATLRDAVRGRCLFVEPVITAARAARARGVEVTLLDDRGDAPAAEPAPA
ncbi:hypothetical protein D6T64_00095, partial [Cryobacterium melibiosiphilum]